MMPIQFDYAAPTSLQEAITLLRNNRHAVALAGGLSLLTDIKLGRISPSMLVDLRRIPDLQGIARETSATLTIGAMTPCRDVAGSEEIKHGCGALYDAVEQIGDQQVRNQGTIGGNLLYQNPSADLPAVVLALGATLLITGNGSTRESSVDEFFSTPNDTRLTPGEIVTSLKIDFDPEKTKSAYVKHKHPASGYAVCGVAVRIDLDSNNELQQCRLAVTGATETPQRLQAVESALLQRKKVASESIVAVIAQVEEEPLNFISDLYASAEYRAHLLRISIERALTRVTTA
jgi:carbon-monoxide dehydrogenase medium subunit